MDSWDKSDSIKYGYDWSNNDAKKANYYIGENDLQLAQKLIKAGSEHHKFMRQISISVDITAPRYWWAEYDTYKVSTVANSCSTMHKIKDYPFVLDMFVTESESFDEEDISFWEHALRYYEYLRQKYNETKDMKTFRKLKQALAEGFLQKRTCTSNYENAFNMARQREPHRLLEWREDFMNFLHELPYSQEMIFLEK
jgi:hypothetical protein